MSQIFTRPHLPNPFPPEHRDLYPTPRTNSPQSPSLKPDNSPQSTTKSHAQTKCASSQTDPSESPDTNLSLYSSSSCSVSIEEQIIDTNTITNYTQKYYKFAPSIAKSTKKCLSKIQEVDSIAYGSEPELSEFLDFGVGLGLVGSQRGIGSGNFWGLMRKRGYGSQSGRVIGTLRDAGVGKE
jgi:hypothetical protein